MLAGPPMAPPLRRGDVDSGFRRNDGWRVPSPVATGEGQGGGQETPRKRGQRAARYTRAGTPCRGRLCRREPSGFWSHSRGKAADR